MGCERWREALSARLDGEEDAGESALVDAHLADCAGCRRWYDDAARVTRLARVAPVPGAAASGTAQAERDAAATGLSPNALVRVLAAAPGRRWARWATGLRVALGLLGAGQVLLAVAQMAAPTMAGAMSAMGGDRMEGASVDHLVHESGAWNLAVGAGFLFIAWRRSRPAGVLPMLTAFVGVLTLMSLGDLAEGMVSPARLASHVLLVLGYVIVVVLSRPSMDLGGPAGTGRRAGRRAELADPGSGGSVVPLRRAAGSPTREARARDRGAA